MATNVLEVSYGVINVPTSVGKSNWQKCIEETAERCELFGINEVFTKQAKNVFENFARENRLGTFALASGPNPVFYEKARWTRIAGSEYKLHGRGPYYIRYPGFNDARYATVSLYESDIDPRLPNLVHIHTHWVPRGPKVPNWWRERARKKAITKISEIVARHRRAGHFVLLTGDLNLEIEPDIHGITWIKNSGVDKMGVGVPRGWSFKVVGSDTYPAPTDHKHGRAASVRFKKNHS